MIATQEVTGAFSFPDDTQPAFARVEFILGQYDIGGDVVIPATITAVVDTDGTFTVDLWPNDEGPRDTSYKVFFVNYASSTYQRELSRTYLGSIRVVTSESPQTLQGLLDAGTYDPIPQGSCLLFLHDDGLDQSLRVTFANGVTKTIADWVA